MVVAALTIATVRTNSRRASEKAGRLIKTLRDSNGWTQEELAKRAGMTRKNYITELETGKTNPTWERLNELSVAFGYEDAIEMFADPDADPPRTGERRLLRKFRALPTDEARREVLDVIEEWLDAPKGRNAT